MNELDYYKTDYLFPNMSFISGMGSIIDLSGNYFEYNLSESSEEADRKAIHSDWQVIGQDIYSVFKKINEELNDKEQQN